MKGLKKMKEVTDLTKKLEDNTKYRQRRKLIMFSDKVYEFSSLKQASKELGINISTISKHIHMGRKFSSLKDGRKVKFMFVNEYNNLTTQQIKDTLAEINGTKLVILNTGKEFLTIDDVSKYVKVSKSTVVNT